LQVKGIFKITKTEVICGGQVTKGTLRSPALARVLRDKEIIADNLEVTKLQRGPTEVSEVPEGEMCGLSFHSEMLVRVEVRVILQENDRIELLSAAKPGKVGDVARTKSLYLGLL
jgi:translation initiation factor IF-2